jgi:hypothetical protein
VIIPDAGRADHARPRFPAGIRLQGQGLILREWTEDDLTTMVELFDDPEGDGPSRTTERGEMPGQTL